MAVPNRISRRSSLRRAALAVAAACGAVTGTRGEEVFLEVPDPPQQHAAPADLLDDLQLNELDKEDRIDELQGQLQALRRLLDRRRAPPPVMVPHLPPPSIPDAPSQLDVAAHPPQDGHESPGSHPQLPDVAGPHEEPDPAAPDAFPDGIVDGPVDRLALADSLYAGGQIDLALQTYGQVDGEQLTAEDRLWIDFQIASCHRRLGNDPEAEQRYRRLAGTQDGGVYASQSRWWLDAMTARRALESDLQRVTESLKSLEQQSHATAAN